MEKKTNKFTEFLSNNSVTIALTTVVIVQAVLLGCLGSKNLKLRGENDNWKDLNKGLSKQVENMAYHLGKSKGGSNE